jgi:predicted dehydrogenase
VFFCYNLGLMRVNNRSIIIIPYFSVAPIDGSPSSLEYIMSKILKWGILGTGMIARKFAGEIVKAYPGCLLAAGSRRKESAEAFAMEFGCTGYADYEEVLAEPDVQAVYIALPNGLHHEWSIKAMEAGKHVLCEKPIASNAREAKEMFEVADRTGRTLIEAFMYRTHPAIRDLIQRVTGGEIGQVRLIRTNFSFERDIDPSDARYHPSQAGGSLMDVGCYCTNLCRALTGQEPSEISVIAHKHESGVDDYAVGLLSFENNALATFTCGMTVKNEWSTFIAGTDGQIKIENPWFCNGTFDIIRPQGLERIEVPATLGSYAQEAEAFTAAVLGDAPPWTTREDTIGNMNTLDQLRKNAGIPFPE